MSHKLEQVKLLLRGIRTDNDSYHQLHNLLKEQRMCMIRRASDALLAINAQIDQRYSVLNLSACVRRETLLSLGVTADSTGLAQVFRWLPAVQKAAARQAWQQLEENIAACQAADPAACVCAEVFGSRQTLYLSPLIRTLPQRKMRFR